MALTFMALMQSCPRNNGYTFEILYVCPMTRHAVPICSPAIASTGATQRHTSVRQALPGKNGQYPRASLFAHRRFRWIFDKPQLQEATGAGDMLMTNASAGKGVTDALKCANWISLATPIAISEL